MADTKLQDFSEEVSPAAGDFLYMSKTVGGGDFKVQITNIPAAAEWVKIEHQSITSAALAKFINIGSTYDRYWLLGTEVRPATDGDEARILVSDDNGVSFKSTGYKSNTILGPSNSGTDGTNPRTNSIIITFDQGNGTGESLSFDAKFSNPAGTTFYKLFNILADTMTASAGLVQSAVGSGAWTGGTGAIDAIQFEFLNDDIAVGEFTLYGLKR